MTRSKKVAAASDDTSGAARDRRRLVASLRSVAGFSSLALASLAVGYLCGLGPLFR